MKGNKFLAAVLAASMAFSTVPATTLSVFAATATSTAGASATADQQAAAAAIQGVLKDITLANDAAGTNKASRLALTDADTGLDKVSDAVKTLDASASVAIKSGSASYVNTDNQLKVTLTISGSTSAKYDGDYAIVIDADVTQEDAEKAVEDVLKGLDLTYNGSLSEAKNEYNVKQAAQEALSNLDTGLRVGEVNYNQGGSGSVDSYNIEVGGVFQAGDYDGVVIGTASEDPSGNVTVTAYKAYNNLTATSADASTLEDAASALSTYKTSQADAATTEDEISQGVQDALDKYAADNSKDFDKVTFTVENFKKTDDAITADVVLKQGNATKTVKLNKAIDKTGLAGTALSGINATNLKAFSAGYNFTKDTDGVATGLDSDALATAVKKSAEKALKTAGYTNAVANVTITTYEADKNNGNGYAAGTVTVTRNGETSSAKIFTINATITNGSYVYNASSDSTVSDATVLQKSDNQKIASVVAALDKAVKKDATLGIKNKTNKNVPLTKNDVLTQAINNPKITAVGTEGVALKYAVSADGKKVDPDNTDAKAIVVKSYTAPTTEAEGTAVITVNYNILMDGKTSGSKTASDYVSASHDITLTFPKLSARKTTAIDVKDSTSKIELTMNASETTDAKDYFDFNGNSALKWTSSDPSVFTVDADGNLVPVGIGEATLTVAVADNDSVKATKTVKVSGTTAFKDVQNPNAWYYGAIYSLANYKDAKGNAIVQGIAKDEFGVSAPITRAQFVTFLYRLADEPVVSTATSFTDVSSSASYAKAVAWAAQKGIVNGKTDTTFAPNDTVTRSEAVTMLYRYNGKPAYNSDITTAFSDVASSAYYYDAVQWASGKGITNGKTSTTFAPNDSCTRAEGITMIYRGN
jgi:hypothetical protein